MRILLVALLLCAFCKLEAQFKRTKFQRNKSGKFKSEVYYYGFKGGVNYGTIDDIRTTIIRPFFPEETYSTQSEGLIGYSGGLFFYFRFLESSVAIQPEITYSIQGGRFKYNDIDDLAYQIDFNYQYLNLGTFLKIYPFSRDNGGFHFSGGPRLSFNMANEKIDYQSNRPDIGPDLQIQQNLRDVLKGDTLFSIGMGIGYDFSFGMSLEARYFLGVSDVIETQANGYNFIENDNRSNAVQVTLGYVIPFTEYSKF